MTVTGSGSSTVASRSNSPCAIAVVDQPVDDPLDGGPQLLDALRRERLRDEAAQAGVVRRLAVEHPVADDVPEGRLVLGIGRTAHLLVGGLVQVGPAEATVAQQRVDVRVAR